jgi:ATP-binding cassette subfamily B protein RaxB
MIANYFGYATTIGELRPLGGGTERGVNLESLISTLECLNLSVRPVKVELSGLHLLALPAILHWRFEHFVVLTHVSRDEVTINDPIGRTSKLRFSEISQHFTGVALEVTLTNEFREKKSLREELKIGDLLGRIERLRESLFVIFTLAFVCELLLLAGPLVSQVVVDLAVTSRDTNILLLCFLFFAILVGMQTVVALFRSQMSVVLRTNISLALGTNLFRHLLRLPLPFFERRHLGDIVSRFDSLQALRRAITSGTIEGLLDGIFAALTVAMMAIYSGMLTSIVLGAFALYVVARLLVYRTYESTSREQIMVSSRLQSNFLETLRGIQAIKLNNRESSRKLLWQNLAIEEANLSMTLQKLGALHSSMQNSILGIENALVLVVGAKLVINDTLTIGMLFAFVAFKMQFMHRAVKLVDHFVEFRMLSLHKDRVSDVALEAPEIVEPRVASVDLDRGQGCRLQLVNVSFRFSHNQPLLLRNINLEVSDGESLAIVGPSGCGKSTLLKIMLGLLRPTDGVVLVNGAPLEEFGVAYLREHAGVVMQNDVLFSGTIADNISFFDLSAHDGRIRRSAEQACILSDIERMPMQFRSRVGDMGSALSGGQIQRILIARALYRDPRLLVFDEATSHLDIETESQLVRSIGSLGVTRVIVAHRLESIGSAARSFRLG